MTPKQRRFVDEYLIDGNATRAAKAAGYAGGQSAEVTGHRLLRNPKVAAAIADGERQRQKRTQIDQDWVINKIVKTIEDCESGENRNPHAVLKGTELLGRTLAMFTDVSKSTVTHEFDSLPETELDERIRAQEAVLGVAAREAPKARGNGSDQVH